MAAEALHLIKAIPAAPANAPPLERVFIDLG
jgi:hypothetical protein